MTERHTSYQRAEDTMEDFEDTKMTDADEALIRRSIESLTVTEAARTLQEAEARRGVQTDLGFASPPADAPPRLGVSSEALASRSFLSGERSTLIANHGNTQAESKRSQLGRVFRSFAGVDEETLADAWPERHQYVGMGGIVLGTALMAAASMTVAIALVAAQFHWYYLFLPLCWGLFVFNLDRWLVSSTHGPSNKRALVPRAALAILFGFIIAEPVVLWVFQGAIESQITAEQAEEADQTRTLLVACNPVSTDGTITVRSADECQGYILNVEAPVANSNVTSRLQAEADELLIDVNNTQEDLRSAQSRLQREIVGSADSDTSGRAGIGVIAASIELEISALTARLDALEDERASVNAELSARQDVFATELSDFEAAVVAERQAQLEELQARNEVTPGLLERFEALGRLASQSSTVFFARWLLTVFLIAVDSMPVLVKLMSRKTQYDSALGRRLMGAEHRLASLEAAKAKDEDAERETELVLEGQRRKLLQKHVETAVESEVIQLEARLYDLGEARKQRLRPESEIEQTTKLDLRDPGHSASGV